MAFIRPLHRLFTNTTTNLFTNTTTNLFTNTTTNLFSPFFSYRGHHNFACYSDSNDTESDYFFSNTPNPWLKSGPIENSCLKEEEDVVKVKFYCPGMGQNDFKVSIINESFIYFDSTKKGEVKVDEGDANVHDYDEPRSYSGYIKAPEGYKVDDLKYEVKNGVLELLIPKILIKERDDDVNFISGV